MKYKSLRKIAKQLQHYILMYIKDQMTKALQAMCDTLVCWCQVALGVPQNTSVGNH